MKYIIFASLFYCTMHAMEKEYPNRSTIGVMDTIEDQIYANHIPLWSERYLDRRQNDILVIKQTMYLSLFYNATKNGIERLSEKNKEFRENSFNEEYDVKASDIIIKNLNTLCQSYIKTPIPPCHLLLALCLKETPLHKETALPLHIAYLAQNRSQEYRWIYKKDLMLLLQWVDGYRFIPGTFDSVALHLSYSENETPCTITVDGAIRDIVLKHFIDTTSEFIPYPY